MKRALFAGATLLFGLALVGCGGGGGGLLNSVKPQPLPLTGKTAVRAILTSGFQSYRSAVNYPFSGLQLALPPGSRFKLSGQPLRRATISSRAGVVGNATFNADLGLYQTVSSSGNKTTINFYSDAALTQSAGSSTLTAPSGNTVGGSYSSYPATIGITQNITGGAIPCQGSGTITLSDGTGANTIQGTLNLPRTGLKVTANLSLNASGNVGGTATIVGNGQTISVSNLSGPFPGDLTGQVAVAPDGTAGTATLNLATGKFIVQLQTKDGAASGNSDGNGGLNIAFPDGTGEKLASPLGIIGGQTAGGTPTTTATATQTPTATPVGTPSASVAYNAPISLGSLNLTSGLKSKFVNNNGEIVGTGSDGNALYLANPTAAPVALPAPYRGAGTIGINNSSAVLGISQYGSYLWANPSATPAPLQYLINGNADFYDFASAVNDSGAIVGRSLNTGSALFWSSASMNARPLAPLPGKTGADANDINNSGLIVGSSFDSNGSSVPVYWPGADATPQPLNISTAAGIISQGNFNTFGLNNSGQIYGSGVGGAALWSSPSAVPVVLPALAGASSPSVAGISDNGTLVGSCFLSGQNHAVRWVNGQVQDLNTLIPANSGWVLQQATSISGNGQIVGTGTFNGQNAAFYLSPLSATAPFHRANLDKAPGKR